MTLVRAPAAGRVRLSLFAALLLLLAGTAVAATVAFAIPTDYGPRSYVVYVGSAAGFAPGTIETFRGETGLVYGIWSDGDGTTVDEAPFHLVRLLDGEFLALSAKDPRLGCTVVAGSTGYVPPRGIEGARFYNPCPGALYDLAGRRLFGPGPRDLDRYTVTVMRDGRIRVDLGAISRGAPRLYPFASTDPRSP